MKGQVAALLVGATVVAFGYDSFDPHQQGEVTDYWDTGAYVAAVPVTASGSPGGNLYAGRQEQATETSSALDRAFKTSAIAELAIRIKRYAAQGVLLFLR